MHTKWTDFDCNKLFRKRERGACPRQGLRWESVSGVPSLWMTCIYLSPEMSTSIVENTKIYLPKHKKAPRRGAYSCSQAACQAVSSERFCLLALASRLPTEHVSDLSCSSIHPSIHVYLHKVKYMLITARDKSWTERSMHDTHNCPKI